MKSVRFAAIYDLHCPFLDEEAFQWALFEAESWKPDYFVLGGDWVEGSAASRHPHEHDHDLLDEYEMVERTSREICERFPKAKKVWLEGNHDLNVLDQNRLPKSVRRVVDISKHVPSLSKWKKIPYTYNEEGVFRLGQVTFAHGYQTGANAGRDEAVNLGVPNGLYIHGHTHQPHSPLQAWATTTLPLPYWFANGGTLGPLKPHFMRRKNSMRWGHGVVLGECRMGRLWLPTREWSAEVRTPHR